MHLPLFFSSRFFPSPQYLLHFFFSLVSCEPFLFLPHCEEKFDQQDRQHFQLSHHQVHFLPSLLSSSSAQCVSSTSTGRKKEASHPSSQPPPLLPFSSSSLVKSIELSPAVLWWARVKFFFIRHQTTNRWTANPFFFASLYVIFTLLSIFTSQMK